MRLPKKIHITILSSIFIFSITHASSWIATIPGRTIKQLLQVPGHGLAFRSDTVITGFDSLNGSAVWSKTIAPYRYITPVESGYLAAYDYQDHLAIHKTDENGKEIWTQVLFGDQMDTRWGDRIYQLKNGNIFCSYVYNPTGNKDVGILMVDSTGKNIKSQSVTPGYSTTAQFNEYGDSLVMVSFVRNNSLVIRAYSVNGPLVFERVLNCPAIQVELPLQKRTFSVIDPFKGGTGILQDKSIIVYFYINNHTVIFHSNNLDALHPDSANPFSDTLIVDIPGGGKGELCILSDTSVCIWSSFACNTSKSTRLYLSKYKMDGTRKWSKTYYLCEQGDSVCSSRFTMSMSNNDGGIVLGGYCKNYGVLFYIDAKDGITNLEEPMGCICCETGKCPYVFHPAAQLAASSIDTVYGYRKEWFLDGDDQLVTEAETDSAWVMLGYDYQVPIQRICLGYSNLDEYHNVDTSINADVYVSADGTTWNHYGTVSSADPFYDTIDTETPVIGQYVKIVVRNLNGRAAFLKNVTVFSIDNNYSGIRKNNGNRNRTIKMSNGPENNQIKLYLLDGRKVPTLQKNYSSGGRISSGAYIRVHEQKAKMHNLVK